MQESIDTLRAFAVDRLPDLVIPIAILIVGWVLAILLGALVRRALHRTTFDERIAAKMVGEARAAKLNTERWAGKLVYYVVLLLTAIAVLQAIQLTAATEPLNELLASLLGFVPNLIGAAAIAIVAWLLASLTRMVLTRALDQWEIDRRIRREAGAEEREAPEAAAAEAEEAERPAPISRAIAEAGYWLVWLLFTPALLDALELEGLLVPVQEMVNEALGFLPNLASALLILAVGWLVARVVQRLVANALDGLGADRLSERVGLAEALGKQTLSSLVGLVVYVLILVPVAIGALGALQLEAITEPASNMLAAFLDAVPAIFGAALLVGVAYIAARVLYSVVERLLNGIGFDSVLSKIGVAQEQLGERTPSQLVAGLAMIGVIYFAVIEAAQLLGFDAFAAVGTEFAVLAGHVLLALVIFGFGLYLGKLAADAIERSSVNQARVLGITARIAVLTLAGAMALRQMGIANEIIELAFGLVLGAVAVAAALAFGLGGREAASKTIDELRERLQAPGGSSAAAGAHGAAASGDGGGPEPGPETHRRERPAEQPPAH